jgi:hypothetical protein
MVPSDLSKALASVDRRVLRSACGDTARRERRVSGRLAPVTGYRTRRKLPNLDS